MPSPSAPKNGATRARVESLRLARVAVLLILGVSCSSSPATRADSGASPAGIPYPPVPNGGGPTLPGAQVVTLSFPGDSRAGDLSAFVDWMASSGWLVRVAGEYGVRRVTHAGQVVLPTSPPSAWTDDAVKAWLVSEVAAGGVPAGVPGGDPRVYVLFLPDGTVITRAGVDACGGPNGNGYHDETDAPGEGAAYAVLPACFPRYSALVSTTGGMMLETARLLADVLTDPSPRNAPAYALTDGSNPWAFLGAEIGDFCGGRLVEDGPGYTLQRVWSNQAASAGLEPCVPAPDGAIPFGVSVSPGGLQTMTVGTPAQFTVRGWSRAPQPAWSIQATPWRGDFGVTVSLDRDTLGDGETAGLTVTVPFAVASGTIGAVLVRAANDVDDPAWPVAFVMR